jgi:hypothetical protein
MHGNARVKERNDARKTCVYSALEQNDEDFVKAVARAAIRDMQASRDLSGKISEDGLSCYLPGVCDDCIQALISSAGIISRQELLAV